MHKAAKIQQLLRTIHSQLNSDLPVHQPRQQDSLRLATVCSGSAGTEVAFVHFCLPVTTGDFFLTWALLAASSAIALL